MLRERKTSYTIQKIIEDLDKTIELSPRNVYAVFNKGNMYMELQDMTSAISCYTQAIEMKPDFGKLTIIGALSICVWEIKTEV